ncbi:UNVERIFIED_CONTAM: hypothetical protein HDU68_002661 [Siphonaria sp. JEL0065]|nr:hypothetical protein HDU68_002661 [Siphonaria sp. JEL0065]
MSFFGFDTSLPGKPGKKQPDLDDDDALGEGSRLDSLLEEKFKFGLELGDSDVDDDDALNNALDGDDDELNDETFGGDAGTDFDFSSNANAFFASNPNPSAISPTSQSKGSRGGSNQPQQSDPWRQASQAYGKSPSNPSYLQQGPVASSAPKMMSLEEIEAQMMAANRNSQPQQQQFSIHQQHSQFQQPQQQQFPGFNQQFPNLSGLGGGAAEKRIMSVTELEESMLRDKQQQQQQRNQPQQHPGAFPQNFPPHQQFGTPPNQFPPGFGQQHHLQQQHLGGPRPNFPTNLQQQFPPNLQQQFPPHLMGPPGMGPSGMGPLGSLGNLHASPGFGMGPPPPGFQQGPPMGGPMLQNQVFGPNGAPQFGSFPGSPRGTAPPASANSPGGQMIGGPPRRQQQQQNQQPGSPVGPFNQLSGGGPHLPNLEQDENLRSAQEAAQQQHQIQLLQQQQQQQHQSSRPAQRGDYGQMRYNNAQAQNNRKNVLLHTGFSNEENHQRGASGKGPGPFDGGWSHQSNKTPRWVRYAESMTQYEKETIARIQISQLVSENPYRDDFYYQIYSQFRSGNGSINTAGANWQQSMLNGGSGGKDISNEMQAQMKKLIEGKNTSNEPAVSTVAMEGALGKISLTSVNNPRKLIQINQAAKQEHAVPTFSRLTRRKILKSIEAVYTNILNIEQLKRKVPEFGNEEEEEWTLELQQNISEMWDELSLAENIPLKLPHPFPYFLSYSKGKRVFPRLVPYLTPDQMFSALTTLFSRAESLDVCNMPAGSQDEAIDLFVSTVIPPLVSFISEVPLQVVNAFMRILLERHNMVWLAKSKAGLAFLALLLSRAEILKQGGGATQRLRPPGADDLTLWFWTELYNFLFASLQGNFAAIFPPTPESTSPTTSTLSKGHDEVYIWQFLAAMAVGATSADHQRVLLTEVRDKIFETSRRGSSSDDPDDARALANVNLFLNALGLGIDASQLASM